MRQLCCEPPRSNANCLDLILFKGEKKTTSSDFKQTKSIQIFILEILTKKDK